MKTIYKYKLELADVQPVNMPMNAEILCAKVQDGNICIWALVDSNAPMIRRVIEIIGTGNPIADVGRSRKYIGTVEQNPFIWHIFEVFQ